MDTTLGSSLRILVVDDDEDDFSIISDHLATAGHNHVTWAEGFSEGLDSITTDAFDVVLIDHRLGASTGLDLIRSARLNASAPPMIIVTGFQDNEVDREATTVGAADYLVKDQLRPEILERSIRYAVSRHHTLRALSQSEQRFRATFMEAPVGMALTDREGQFLDANPAFVGMLGYELSQLMNMAVWEVSHPEDVRNARELFSKHLTNQEPRSSELRCIDSDGKMLWCIVTVTALTNEDPTRENFIVQLVNVTELKDTQEELKRHLDDKNQFLATVSHELRTPLTAVIGLAELLRDPQQTLDSGERASLINTIVESGFDVANLVEDLLTAARQEDGQLKVVAVPVSLAAQVNQTLESMNPSREIKVSGSAPRAFADPGRVRQILRNLLSNAIKYGGQQVSIHLDQMGETVRAAIIDDGLGVSSGQEDRIFDRYERAHDDDSHPGSVGIGLSISRDLARHMGGDLKYVRSNGTTRFELLLPVHDD